MGEIMNEQLDGRIELGKQMWNVQAPGFIECAKRNGVESAEDLAALFAGFMAAATGSMISMAGPQMAMSVLGSVSKSCAAQTVERYVAGCDGGDRQDIVVIGAGGRHKAK